MSMRVLCMRRLATLLAFILQLVNLHFLLRNVWRHYTAASTILLILLSLALQNSALYLEFIQHHLLMGASHIFITAALVWGGKIMTTLQRVLRSFIEDGSVSITSHSDDNVDFLYSIRGLGFHRDNLKTIQVLHRPHCSSSIALCCLLFSF